MTEYIVSELDLNRLVVNYMESRMSLYSPISEPERIVRCKDCKHLVGVGIDFYYCELFRARGPYDYELHKPAYDGFCAWGEAKVVE